MEGLVLLPKAKRIAVEKTIKHTKYSLIKEYSEKHQWSIYWMCDQLKISRSAYYKWTNRSETPLERENSALLEDIRTISLSNNRLFGTLKMTDSINKKFKTNYNHKRIYRLMCINNLLSLFRKTTRKSWKKSQPEITAENILNRKFEVSQPNEVWCTDITEIAYPGIPQKAYISSYLDLYDRSVPGLSVSKRNDAILTYKSLKKAIESNPTASPLHHSDRGFQYTRAAFKSILESQGMVQSMSRVGRCIDNGPMECFQGIFKELLVILHPNLKSYEELEQAIYHTLDYYHYDYPQRRFKGLTPLEVRNKEITAETPTNYPIKPNPQVVKFWKNIEHNKKAKLNGIS